MERTKKFPWNVWMDRPAGGRQRHGKRVQTLEANKESERAARENNDVRNIKQAPGLTLCHPTFGAAYPHDGLEADLPVEVPLQILLEALHLRRVVLVVVGGIVVDASCRVSGYAACERRILSNETLPHSYVT